MTAHPPKSTDLVLVPVRGQAPKIVLSPQTPRHMTLGRSRDSSVVIPDPSVSRKHAVLSRVDEQWYLADEGSTRGVSVNGLRIPTDPATPVSVGDFITLGDVDYQVSDRSVAGVPTEAGQPGEIQAVDSTTRTSFDDVAQSRLAALLACAAEITAAQTESELANAVVRAALRGTGFSRCALLRPRDRLNSVDVIAMAGPGAGRMEQPYSRSLLRHASVDGTVRIAPFERSLNASESIRQLEIHSAICSPIRFGAVVAAYLYLDARGDEPSIQPEAEVFCEGLARICSLAYSKIKQAELEQKRRLLIDELAGAREAQEAIMPPLDGRVGGVEYSLRVRSGQVVAGDLADVIALDNGRTAILLGDVAGKGAATGIIMAAAQSHLRSGLVNCGALKPAVESVNRFLCGRMTQGRFISLWAAVVHPEQRSMEILDAGHGYWLTLSRSGNPKRPELPRGHPLGIERDATFHSSQIALDEHDRVVVFSDGLVEQVGGAGEHFGIERVREVLQSSGGVAEDADHLLEAVQRFAGTAALTDDTTIASFTLGRQSQGSRSAALDARFA